MREEEEEEVGCAAPSDAVGNLAAGGEGVSMPVSSSVFFFFCCCCFFVFPRILLLHAHRSASSEIAKRQKRERGREKEKRCWLAAARCRQQSEACLDLVHWRLQQSGPVSSSYVAPLRANAFVPCSVAIPACTARASSRTRPARQFAAAGLDIPYLSSRPRCVVIH